MAVRSGRYRHRFELHTPKLDASGEPARNGYGELTGETQCVARPWCEILDVKSSENSSTATVGQETITFEIRYSKMFDNPDTAMYIIYKKEKYDIISAVDPFHRNEKMHIIAVRRR